MDNLLLLNQLHNSYEKKIEEMDSISKEVEIRLKEHLNYNNLKLLGQIPYYTLHNLLKTKERILEIDEDGIIAVIGEAGTGKTSISILFSFFLDKDFSQIKIIFTFEELLKYLKLCAEEIQKELSNTNYKSNLRGSTIILDEGVFILFSADTLSKQGKLAVKLFTVIRFLNIVMFICMTNFDKVNKTVRDSRLYSSIQIQKKGVIEYRSKLRTRNITVDDTGVHFTEPNFTEKVGFIQKDCQFWKEYNQRKGQFVSNAITEILEDSLK